MKSPDTFYDIPITTQPPVIAGDYLVISELSYTYQPVIAGAPGVSAILHGGIEMEKEFYDSPREDTFWRCAQFNNEDKCDVNEYQ